MTAQVTCKNCKLNRASWLSRNFANSVWWTCSLKKSEPVYNVVDGTTKPAEYASCSSVRWDEDLCGENAKAWIPRSKKDLFLLLTHVK